MVSLKLSSQPLIHSFNKKILISLVATIEEGGEKEKRAGEKAREGMGSISPRDKEKIIQINLEFGDINFQSLEK